MSQFLTNIGKHSRSLTIRRQLRERFTGGPEILFQLTKKAPASENSLAIEYSKLGFPDKFPATLRLCDNQAQSKIVGILISLDLSLKKFCSFLEQNMSSSSTMCKFIFDDDSAEGVVLDSSEKTKTLRDLGVKDGSIIRQKNDFDRIKSERSTAVMPYVPKPETPEEKAARLEKEEQDKKLRDRQSMFKADQEAETRRNVQF